MVEDRDDEPEGWGVPFRIGALCAVGIPVALGLTALATAVAYDRTLRPSLKFSVSSQPAPSLETKVHAGVMDSETPAVPVRPDPAIERAKAEIAKEGIAGWTRS